MKSTLNWITERDPAGLFDWEAVAVPDDPALRQPQRPHGPGQSQVVTGEPQRRRAELPGPAGTQPRTGLRHRRRSFRKPSDAVHPQSGLVDLIHCHQQQPLPRLFRSASGCLLRGHHFAAEGPAALSPPRIAARIVLPPVRLRWFEPLPQRFQRLPLRRRQPQITR